MTGSQDHTLKVYRVENGDRLYTLHGHCGPITCLFIDRVCPATSGSGSQDGMLCVWDLLSGKKKSFCHSHVIPNYFRNVHVQHPSTRRLHHLPHLLGELRNLIRNRRTPLRVGTFPRSSVEHHVRGAGVLQSRFNAGAASGHNGAQRRAGNMGRAERRVRSDYNVGPRSVRVY